MAENSAVVIPNITSEQIDKLRSWMIGQGGKAPRGNSGRVENDCFAADIQYDPNSKLLTLQPVRLVKTLTSKRLDQIVAQLLAPPPAPILVDSVAGDPITIYKPTPMQCACYCWAIGFIVNNSGQVLTFSDDGTIHGDFQTDKLIDKIPPSEPLDKHKDGFWVVKEPKNSTLGVEGSIGYGLADGVTSFLIKYSTNTSGESTATVALNGQNKANFRVKMDKYDNFARATTYLYPYVTISKV